MRRWTSIVLLFTIACSAELPTEPLVEGSPVVSQECFEDGPLRLLPRHIVLEVGDSFQATARHRFSSSPPPFDIFSTDESVAIVEGLLDVGTSAEVTMKAVAPGRACVRYLVPQFAQGYRYGNFGMVQVMDGMSRRRAVRN